LNRPEKKMDLLAPHDPRLGLVVRSLPVVATSLLIAALWLAHMPALPVGGLSGYDEFYTFDRSSAFLRMGDWFSVFSGNEPNFRKPPLQYWISAGLLEMGLTEVLALRLPSMIFALGTLVGIAWLARVIAPQVPWAMPLSVLLLSSSGQFWAYANSAMLDMGATFFTTVALVGAVIAIERPRAWYLVAVFLGLGALQKAPTALPYIVAALCGLWLAQRWIAFDVRTVTRSTPFRRATWLSLALVLAWPVLQSARYGFVAFKQSHDREMLQRFAPDASGGGRSLPDVIELLITDEPWLRWPALAAVLMLPLLVRRPSSVMMLAVIVFYAFLLLIAGGNLYARYTLTVLPVMTAALAVVLSSLWPRPWAGLVGAVLAAGLSGGPVKLELLRTAALQPPHLVAQIDVLRSLGAEMGDDETLVYCHLVGERPLIPGAVSVYASNGRPIVTTRHLERLAEPSGQGPFRGICPRSEVRQLASLFDGFSVTREEGDYVLWTARGLR
jgi:4-amino-4-deoxy-L-arabinose transferase-like glycosyltransferase